MAGVSADACCAGLRAAATEADAAKWSVKELKQYLAERKIDTTDCVEKSEFVAKVQAAIRAGTKPVATADAQPAAAAAAGAAAAAAGAGAAAAASSSSSASQAAAAAATASRTCVLHTRAVGPLQCNMCIIADPQTKQAVLVDPGGDADKILADIKTLGVTVVQIVVTHAHFDHFLAAGEVKAATGAPICLHKADAQLWSFLPMQCALIGLPAPTKPMPAPDVWLSDGDKLKVLDGTCVHTPGHSPGSTCFHWPSQRLLCSGDTLFRLSVGRTDLMGGDSAALKQSIQQKLYALPGETEVIPGHGERTAIAFEKKNNMVIRATGAGAGAAL